MNDLLNILGIDQYKNILEGLKKFKEERKLSSEMQLDGLLANILEELTEYTRAQNVLDKVDALCDIIVFILNATKYTDINNESENDLIDNFQSFLPIRKSEFDFRDTELAKSSINTAQALIEAKSDKFFSEHIILELVNELILDCVMRINELNYSPYNCTMETIKEISSRRGEWNDNIKKFVKYKGAYSKEDAINKITNNLSYSSKNVKLEKEDDEYYYISYDKRDESGKYRPEVTKLCKWYKANYEDCYYEGNY